MTDLKEWEKTTANLSEAFVQGLKNSNSIETLDWSDIRKGVYNIDGSTIYYDGGAWAMDIDNRKRVPANALDIFGIFMGTFDQFHDKTFAQFKERSKTMTEKEYLELLAELAEHDHAMKKITLKIREAGWSYPLSSSVLYFEKVSNVQMSGSSEYRLNKFVSDSVISETEHTIERSITVNGVRFYEVIEFKKKETDNE